MMTKDTFMTAQQVNTSLQDVGEYFSLLMMQVRFHDLKLRGFTTRCKPKPQKQKWQVAVYKEKPVEFSNNVLWADEAKINLYQNDDKREV